MKSSRLEEAKDIEENINKNVKNLFILKKHMMPQLKV